MLTNNVDYPVIYTIIPIYDMEEDKRQIYGYIACKSYLIDEIVINNRDGTIQKKYEVVCEKDEKSLSLSSYENLDEQQPLFANGKCINSIVVEEVYDIYDTAKNAREVKCKQLYEKLAKDAYIPPPSFVKNFMDLKRAIDIEKARLAERLNELNVIEKHINHQIKRI